MKRYYAWSYEHFGAFWKKGKCGYTFFEGLAHQFSEEEILLYQIGDSYSGWSFVDADNIGTVDLSEKNEWAVCVDDAETIKKLKSFIPQWNTLANMEVSRMTDKERYELYKTID